jgi:Zn-dependent peptidase ImmA (M78 family)
MRLSYPLLEKKAEDFRQKCGYGTDKPINFQGLLLELNVPTFFKPMKKISGMAFKSETDVRFILINSSQTIGRQNFTLCHELYHLFIQKKFEHQVCITQQFNKKDTEEYNADVFASFLLLPSKGIRDLIPEDELEKDAITLDTIVKIEQAFQSSRQALLFRLKSMSFLSDAKSIEYSQWVRNSAYTRGYPAHLYSPNNSTDVWGDYGESALELFQTNKISEGDYASIMIDIGVDILQMPKDDDFDF